MMMRADEEYTEASEGCSMNELLACFGSDDVAACMAACNGNEEEEEENLPGYAKVTGKAAASQDVAVNAVNKKIGTITLKAGENDTTVSSVVIAHSGLGDASTVSAQLFYNGVAATSQKEMSKSSQSVTLKLSPAVVIKANSSITFDVVASLDGTVTGNANETHNFSVTAVNVANGTADGTPVALGTLRTTSYEAGTVNVTLTASTALKAGDTEKVLATVKVTPTRKGRINGFTITKDSGNEDLDELVSNVKAYYNDEEIGDVDLTADKIVVSNLKLDRNAGQSATIELKGDVIFAGGNVSSNLVIEKNEVLAVESNTDENMGSAKTPISALQLAGAELTLKNMVSKAQTVTPGSEAELLNVQVSSKTELEVTEFYVKFTSPVGAAAFADGSCSTDGADQTACEAADSPAVVAVWSGDNKCYIDGTLSGTLTTEGACTGAAVAAHTKGVWTPNFGIDNTVTIYVDGEDYEMKPSVLEADGSLKFTSKQSFVVSQNSPVVIKAVANFDENAKSQTYTMDVALSGAKATNGNGTISLGSSMHRAGHTTTLKNATATIKAATKAAPVTSSLFANDEQEIARFAIKADGDAVTVKSLSITATPDGTTADADEIAELLNGNVRLVDVETNEEITATFEDLAAGVMAIKSMNYDIAKDATANIKVMANISSISENPTNVINGTLTLTVNPGTFKTSTTAARAMLGTTSGKTYKFRATAPSITLAKASDNMFELTITNQDDNDDGIIVNNLVYRVRTNTTNSDFSGVVCLVDDVNTVTCPANTTTNWTTNTAAFGTNVTHKFGTWSAGVYTLSNKAIAENDSATFYILIDGTSIEPDVLKAEVSALNYEVGTNPALDISAATYTEKYSISKLLND